jgi:hypothetical protein
MLGDFHLPNGQTRSLPQDRVVPDRKSRRENSSSEPQTINRWATRHRFWLPDEILSGAALHSGLISLG